MGKDEREIFDAFLRDFNGYRPTPLTQDDIESAIRYILKRLGPPDPLDGVEAEKLTEPEA